MGHPTGTVERNDRRSIHGLYPITNEDLIEWKSRLSLIQGTNINFKLTSALAVEYIRNHKADYEF